MQTESANHAESTGDAQEKSVRSYELEFAPDLELILVDRFLLTKSVVRSARSDVLFFKLKFKENLIRRNKKKYVFTKDR
jgi:hypothetical protein